MSIEDDVGGEAPCLLPLLDDEGRVPDRPPMADRAKGELQRAAGVLLIDERGWILLQLRDAHGAYPHHWGTVGGKAEPGETDDAAARRELAEETGYVAGPLHYGAAVHVTLPDGTPRVATLFYARYDCVQPIVCLEGARMEFVDPARLDTLLVYPGQEPLIRAALRAAGGTR